jgi:Protein of unknown function (DUF4230)
MLRVYIFLFACCWCITSGCGKPANARQREILAIREMSDLVTVEYVVTKIIKASDNKTWYKTGDRKILMSCRASIKAGIDLSAIKEENIQVDGKNISIQVPASKIISLNMPPENIVVEYQEIDIFRSPFKAGERDVLAAQAETQIRSSAEVMGILQTADANTNSIITDFLKRAGYKGITITTPGSFIPKPKLD